MENLLNTPLIDGKSIMDLLTLEFVISLLGDVLTAVVILIVAFILSGWAGRQLRSLGLRYDDLDDTLFAFLGNIVRYVILGFAVLFVLNTFGVQTTSFVAVIGAAGLAIGLALQGTLSNIAAGVMLILFRPIKLEDFVEVDGKMGTVKDINLNFIVLADMTNAQIIVPNAVVWGNTIKNYSVNKIRRAQWSFGVSYSADLAKTQSVILDTIMADERSMTDPEPFIQVNNLNDSSVDFLVRVWCDSEIYFAYKADMTRAVKEALDDAGIEIPFPTRTFYQVKD